MMAVYHQRTLDLLGDEGKGRAGSAAALREWAEANRIALPEALLEWVELDGKRLLEKHSATDTFPLDEPELVITPEGTRGLKYHVETQGNFTKIVTLDAGDDPPVLYCWVGEPPWITRAESFSDDVFAQIFDWQYLLEFTEESPDAGEMAFSAEIYLQSGEPDQILRETFSEAVSTQYRLDEGLVKQYRFFRSDRERVTLAMGPNGISSLQITGDMDLVLGLEAELFEEFSDDLLLPGFGWLSTAASELDRWIRVGSTARILHSFVHHPESDAMQRLFECHAESGFWERLRGREFPDTGEAFRVGGPEWGLAIHFTRADRGYYKGSWLFDRLEIMEQSAAELPPEVARTRRWRFW